MPAAGWAEPQFIHVPVRAVASCVMAPAALDLASLRLEPAVVAPTATAAELVFWAKTVDPMSVAAIPANRVVRAVAASGSSRSVRMNVVNGNGALICTLFRNSTIRSDDGSVMAEIAGISAIRLFLPGGRKGRT